MRTALVCLAVFLALAACAKPPANTATNTFPIPAVGPSTAAPQTNAVAAAPATGGAVSGVFTGDGKQSNLTEVTAHPDDPFDGKPVTALVFSVKDQGADPKPAESALFGNFGDAIVARVEADGTVVGADVIHSALQSPGGSVSLGGVLSMKSYSVAGGQISGELTSGGETDVFGHKLNIDVTFHAKAP